MGHKYIKEDETFSTSQNGVVPKPTASDVSNNKVLRADGSWVAQPGGGGGASTLADLDDVNISNLQDHQPLRYDASSQIWRNGADNYPPIIYSDTEREVGVWRDGKPLYEKTYIFTINDLDGTYDASVIDGRFQLSRISYDMIWIENGFIHHKNASSLTNTIRSNATVYPNWENDRGVRANIQVTSAFYDGYPYIYYKQTYSPGLIAQVNNLKFIFVIRYTKTTDTAGSGTWTTQGGYAHHYSTTEHVIGTWTDGKPLYERVIDLGQLPNANTKVVQTVDVYPDTIVSFEAYAKRHIVGISKGTFTLPFVSTTLAAQISCYVDIFDDNPSALCVTITTGNDRSNMTGHAIVRYTKTTD